MFRCPHCGEKVFWKFSKMGIRFVYVPTCPVCKKDSTIKTFSRYISCVIFDWISIIIMSSAFSLYYFFHIISGITCVILHIIALCFYFLGNYYLCHYEMHRRHKKELPKMYVKTAETKKLWPNFRSGEIYVIVPEQLNDLGKEEFQTIAFLEKKEKSENECVFVFNVIRTPYADEVIQSEYVKIINDFDSNKYRMIKGRVL